MDDTIRVEDRPCHGQTYLDGLLMAFGRSMPPRLQRYANGAGILYYRRRLKRNRYDSNAFYFLGNLHMGSQQYEAAAQAYANVIHLTPKHAISYGNLACAYMKLHRYEEAQATMEQAVLLNPEHVPYIYLFGYISGSLKNYPEAVGACKRVLLLDPEHEGALFLGGYGCLKVGLYEEAVRYLSRYAEIHPDHAPTFHYLGLAHIKLGNLEEAAAALRKSGEMDFITENHDEPMPEPAREAVNPAWRLPSMRPLGKIMMGKRHSPPL